MGRFAQFTDVASRFEGTIPSGREAWVETRIDDVEGILMGLVPSLTVSVSEITTDRLQRVKTLVCDKVLHLYRNPDGATQWSNTVDDVTESRTYGHGKPAFSAAVFTSSELRSVRIPRVKNRVGTIPVAPWKPRRCF